MNFPDVRFEDYERDTREQAEQASAIIEDLRRQIKARDDLIWAMVRSAGGRLFVCNSDLIRGVPKQWRIEEDVADCGRTFIVGKPD